MATPSVSELRPATAAASSSVRVVVRLRPPSERERATNDALIVDVDPARSEVRLLTNVKRGSFIAAPASGSASSLASLNQGTASAKEAANARTFTYDQTFDAGATQEDVYAGAVKPLIEEVLAGFSCTVFAYGQTGTGKTHTMGSEASVSNEVTSQSGIIPRAIHTIFDQLSAEGRYEESSVKVSFLELYNEELADLLDDPEERSGSPKELRIFEDTSNKKQGMMVQNLEEVRVTSPAQVFALLQKANKNRRVAETNMNARSSRSHYVFTITVSTKEVLEDGEEISKTGKLFLVDLAGSECIGKSGATEKRAKEAGKINQSLLTLGRVINGLVDRSSFIPYRDSKLTRLLQESLGGRAKAVIIATVSPSYVALDETLSTLEYAHRAKSIKNKPQQSVSVTKRGAAGGSAGPNVQDLLLEIVALKRENAALRTEQSMARTAALDATNEATMAELATLHERHASREADLAAAYATNEATMAELAALRDEREILTRTIDEQARAVAATEEAAHQSASDVDTLRDENVSLRADLREMAARVTTLSDEKASLEAKVAEIVAMAASLGATAAAEESASRSAASALDALRHENVALTAQLTTAQTEALATRKALELLQTTHDDLQARHVSREADLVAAHAAHEVTTAKLTALCNDNQVLTRTIDEQARAMALAAEEKAACIETMREEKVALAAQLSTAHTQMAVSRQALEALQTKVTDLATLVATREIERDAARTAHEATKDELAALRSECDALSRKVDAQACALNATEDIARQSAAACDALRDENASLTAQLTTPHTEVATLHATLRDLEARLVSHEADLATAQIAHDATATALAALKNERDALLTKIEQQTRSIASLEAELTEAQTSTESSSRDNSLALVTLQGELHSVQERFATALAEREAWLVEMEACRAEEARAVALSATTRADLSAALERLAQAQEQVEELKKTNVALEETNAALTGHQNQRQKIQHHQAVKRAADQLRVEKAALERELAKYRKLHHVTVGGAVPAALEKELAKADAQITAGEKAQVQLQALCERIASLDTKFGGGAHAAAVAPAPSMAMPLADITNRAPSTAATAKTGSSDALVKPAAADVANDSFPACLSTLSAFAASFTRLSTQLEAARRETNAMRNAAKLQQMKDNTRMLLACSANDQENL